MAQLTIAKRYLVPEQLHEAHIEGLLDGWNLASIRTQYQIIFDWEFSAEKAAKGEKTALMLALTFDAVSEQEGEKLLNKEQALQAATRLAANNITTQFLFFQEGDLYESNNPKTVMDVLLAEDREETTANDLVQELSDLEVTFDRANLSKVYSYQNPNLDLGPSTIDWEQTNCFHDSRNATHGHSALSLKIKQAVTEENEANPRFFIKVTRDTHARFDRWMTRQADLGLFPPIPDAIELCGYQHGSLKHLREKVRANVCDDIAIAQAVAAGLLDQRRVAAIFQGRNH